MFYTKLINVEDSGYIFPNLFTGFVFFMIFCSFLFRHFTVIDEPTLNFSFYKHITVTWIFSRADYIEFHEKHFFKHETLRKDFEKSHITLHEKKDLNLQPVEGFCTLCTDFHWIQVAVAGLLITKIFFKYTVNVAVYKCNSAYHYLHCFSQKANSVITVA